MKSTQYLIIFATIITLTACGNKEVTQTEETSVVEESGKSEDVAEDTHEAEETNDNSETVSAEKNLFSVEVTLPASMFEESTDEEIETSAEESGINDVKFNEDGSVTYKMSKSKHKELLDSMKAGIDEAITEMLNDKETYPSFTEITYNNDCTEFTIKCDSSSYTEMDTLYALNFYMQGWYYQVFDGVSEEDLKVVVNFVDKDTDEILSTGDSSQIE